MELPQRPKCDRHTSPGRYRELQTQVYRGVRGEDIPTLFVYAFDPRTHLGPFVFFDRNLIPGAPLAVASALYAAGLTNLRIVMQPWNPKFRPSLARLDGRPPQMLYVSSMQIHSESAYSLIRDAWRLKEARPLILAGGPKAIYEPWDFFGLSPDGREGADVVVTGEEFVILELLDRILEHKRAGESMRAAFERVRSAGLLEDVPGLTYRPDPPEGPPDCLVNTGTQRLVRDLDELPLPFDALGLFEPPHRRTTLSGRPMTAARLSRYGRIASIVTTRGCKFHCHYCPIPAYNQFTYRHRSPERMVEEIAGISERSGIRSFFGTDDNFFNDRDLLERTLTAMARGEARGKPFRKAIRFATEATEFDVFKHRDLLRLARDAGVRNLWFGIEDLTAELVKKGQSPEKTQAICRLLLQHGIAPMPMMIHHDGQPLFTWRGLYGLVNQILFLRRVGALTCQITMLTPMVGSKSYEQLFREGNVLSRVGGKSIQQYQYDGNHCVATNSPHPWLRQLNIFAGYATFYNPVNLLRALVRLDRLWSQRLQCQLLGMLGIGKSFYAVRDWLYRMMVGPIERFTEAPTPKYPMIGPGELATLGRSGMTGAMRAAAYGLT